MVLRRKQSGRHNAHFHGTHALNYALIVFLSLCILLGLFGLRNANAEGEYLCGKEEHTHAEACYEKVLICKKTEEDHKHDENCYADTLICNKEEHVHDESCIAASSDEDEAQPAAQDSEDEDSTPVNSKAGARAASAEGNDPGVNPPNTVINLFDYWTTNSATFQEPYPEKTMGGINRRENDPNQTSEQNSTGTDYNADYNRPLVFWYNTNNSYGEASNWTGWDAKPRSGIVQNSLGSDGYPLINWDEDDYWPAAFRSTATGYQSLRDNNASLAYLFDEDQYPDVLGKKAYSDVTGLFQVDADGYYTYNSNEYYAQFKEDTSGKSGSFTLTPYDETDTVRQFFPFCTLANFRTYSGDLNSPQLNHYFGLTMTTRFIQDYGGHTSAGSTANEMIFDFSGDDDVWIFIDDVLVSDLGGIHLPVGTTINFATGEITYYNFKMDANHNYILDENRERIKQTIKTTTLEEQFNNVYRTQEEPTTVAALANAQKGWTSLKDDQGNDTGNYIFSDNTSHTLQFFYMERGNNQSNMRLTTNLAQIPETSVTKVDQNETPISGVPLAIYQADADTETDSSTYYFVDDQGNQIQPSSVKDTMVDPSSGDITGTLITKDDKLINTKITPRLSGVTADGTGEWVFSDGNGVPYTSLDINNMVGSNQMIMREIKVPDGYRTVSDNIFMYFDKGAHLTVPNPYESGVWPSPNALITATNTLYEASSGNAIDYYKPASMESNGTLFAVVMKRNGAALGNFTQDWTPVYGTETAGYHVTTEKGKKAILEAYLRNINEYKVNPTFTATTAGMQLYLTDMPGSLERYYTYMYEYNRREMQEEENGKEPQYTVCYFYSDLKPEQLKNLTLEDLESMSDEDVSKTITRVVSHRDIIDNGNYDGFYIRWSSTLEISNIENRLYYQKTDIDGNLVNGATFALYDAGEDADEEKKVYLIGYDTNNNEVHIYLGDDPDGDNQGQATVGTDSSFSYTIEKSSGEITVESGSTVYKIKPAVNAKADSLVGETTSKNDNGIGDGTGRFLYLKTGNYILREIAAPEEYLLNTELIKVLVNGDGVYAHAGSTGDGVIVGNGAGYLIPTFNATASPGDIDETLRWIYTLLRVNTSDNSYGAYDYLNVLYTPTGETLVDKRWEYAAGSDATAEGVAHGTTDSRSEAMVTYLEYNGGTPTPGVKSLFDYEANSNQEPRTGTYGTQAGQGTLRLFTDKGWSALSILQDYSFGYEEDSTNKETTYTNLTSQNAYGAKDVNLNLAHLYSNSTFVRVTDPKPILELKKTDSNGNELSGASFVVYTEDEQASQYYQYDANDGLSWVSSQDDATVLSFSGKDTKLNGLSSGTYYLKEIQAPAGHVIETQPWKLDLAVAKPDKNTVPDGTSNRVPEKAVIQITATLTEPGQTEGTSTTFYVLSDGTTTQEDPLELVNREIYELPSAGSFGVLPFILAGSLILGFSVYLLIKEERSPQV